MGKEGVDPAEVGPFEADWRTILGPDYLTKEDVVAKLRLVTLLERLQLYPDAAESHAGAPFYERIKTALRSLPPEHRQAALSVFANVVYLVKPILDSAWVFLCDELVAHYRHGSDKTELARDIHVFEVDPSGMRNDFVHRNGIAGRLDTSLVERVHDLESLLDVLLSLKHGDKDAERIAGRLFRKPYWLILVDNSLSGQSLKSELCRFARIVELLKGVCAPPRMVVLIQVYTSDARAAIEAELGAERLRFFDIRCGLFFDERFKIHSPTSGLIVDVENGRAVSDLCKWFAREHLARDQLLSGFPK